MYILGLGGSLHDFSACLVKDGEIAVAIEEERITRVKHAIDKPLLENALLNNQVWKFMASIPKDTLQRSVDYCLACANISLKDIDFIVTTDSNLHLPYVKALEHLVVMDHHMAHAACAFYPSEFEEAAILIVDGRGSQVCVDGKTGYETVTFAYGRKNKIEVISRLIDHSVGHFYEAVTLGLGFGMLEDGKTMGLSSYGTGRFAEELSASYVLLQNGKIEFTWGSNEIRRYVEKKLEEVKEEDAFQVKADLAYAVQKNLEKIMCHFTDYLHRITNSKNLCIAGGVGLNSVANGVIHDNTHFKNLFIQPASGDNGLAIGAALYGAVYLRNCMRNIK